MTDRLDPAMAAGNRRAMAGYAAQHFRWHSADGVATLTINRPDRRNAMSWSVLRSLRGFLAEIREFYEIERLYLDVPRIDWQRDLG